MNMKIDIINHNNGIAGGTMDDIFDDRNGILDNILNGM